ncbi:MerR family transcriptional regulator [Kitasatospora sp. NPDC059747]|uniref:MerR family transcriptional regulator n=1 Tax=Kitasatospora sp. NPDC059747 TaxID=3346930 RepID=UPI003652437C
MRIGELAELTGTTARALRHYEQAGLLTAGRAPNGYREYGEADAVRVHNIRALLGAGLTLDDLRPLLGCLDGDVMAQPPSARVLGIARDRLAVLERRIAAQTEARDRLLAALAAAGNAVAGKAVTGNAVTGNAVTGNTAVGATAVSTAAAGPRSDG